MNEWKFSSRIAVFCYLLSLLLIKCIEKDATLLRGDTFNYFGFILRQRKLHWHIGSKQLFQYNLHITLK